MPVRRPTPPAAPTPLQKMFKVLIASAAAVSIGACDLTDPVTPSPAPARPAASSSVSQLKEPKLETTVPRYPAVAVHIVYREYLHLNPGITALDPDDKKYQKYMEKRLRELYPKNGGYDGMLADAGTAIKAHRAAWARYERDLARSGGGTSIGIMVCTPTMLEDPETGEPCAPGGGGGTEPGPIYEADVDPSWDGQYEHNVPPDTWVPTVQAETDSLMLEPAEVTTLTYYESLAAQVDSRDDQLEHAPTGTTVTRDDLIRAAALGQTSAGPRTQNIVYGVIGGSILAYVGWHAYRALTAGERAEKLSTRYFGHFNHQNTKRDAYRHIFLSMQLRRYVGGTAAKAITDHREGSNPGPASSTWMDYHNNDVGREHKYHRFRGHWFWDRNDSSEWAEKIFNYVNNNAYGEFISEWSVEPTVTAAMNREALVDNGKFIWFSNAP